jgi:hypothetical protein
MERMLGDVTDNFRSVLPFHALKESLQKPGPETRSDHRALGNDIKSVLAGLALVGCLLRWTALRVSAHVMVQRSRTRRRCAPPRSGR